ncbi:MAG: uncharacterized protein KVP18_002889 [Porospora cf. gigantea A]|uniref:uncharacterized protein n=2 Tax=Porospora cf. gigantea A TaxID=2853593 RepID=UPI00355A8EF3|nr:MAG: hypothetical protein KVP18_002889 [Porospora cf. gigantea A]
MLGFLHPWADAGGGGEMVLWAVVAAALRDGHVVNVTAQTTDLSLLLPSIHHDATREVVDDAVKGGRLFFTRLRTAPLLREQSRFTMLFLALGSFIAALELVVRGCPKDMFDLSGLPFSYPPLWFFGKRVHCYVHYPWIQEDMRALVANHQTGLNNCSAVAQHRVLSNLKMIYYDVLSMIYGFMGFFADTVLVNGTWTYNRLHRSWFLNPKSIVFPPVDVAGFSPPFKDLKFLDDARENQVVCCGQFRREKRQAEAVRIYSRVLLQQPDARLVIVGGCRGESDWPAVEQLVEECRTLGLRCTVAWTSTKVVCHKGELGDVCLLINASRERLQSELKKSKVFLHTMEDEHFGIAVAEGLAAGCVVVAHDSGGPRLDILKPLTPEEMRMHSPYFGGVAHNGPLLRFCSQNAVATAGILFQDSVEASAAVSRVMATLEDFGRQRIHAQAVAILRFSDEAAFGEKVLLLSEVKKDH